MRRVRPAAAVIASVAMMVGSAAAQSPQSPLAPGRGPLAVPAIPRLRATTLRTYDVPEADQGVAVDREHFYAVDNSVIAKYAIGTGAFMARWSDATGGLIRHLNSCLVDVGRLWCANSNYPARPMASSIEVVDTATLTHVESHSLGVLDEGSITWFDRVAGGWIAGFAHYTGNGGVPFKDHSYSSIVAYDAEWRRRGGWLFPPTVVDRLAPDAASGGAIGPDGWLYLTGHDRPEMYVVGRPAMGPSLVHIATIDIEAEGQAFSWAQDGSRTIYVIDRRTHKVRAVAVPALPDAPTQARRLR